MKTPLESRIWPIDTELKARINSWETRSPQGRVNYQRVIVEAIVKIFVVVCLGVGLLCSGVHADGLGEQTTSSLDALEKANAYSFEEGGIGILMSYGTLNTVSADEVGAAFVNEIRRRGYPARYFFYNTKRDGMAIEFFVGYSAFGPWAPKDAAAHVSTVVKRLKSMRKLHGFD